MKINYHHSNTVPYKLLFLARTQVVFLSFIRLFAMILSPFMAILVVKLSEVQEKNIVGTGVTEFNPKYKERGAIGPWVFEAIPLSWRDAGGWKYFIWLFSNDKDGVNGDRRGEYATLSMFKEGSFLYKWWWCGWRNPANNLRYTDLFSCIPDNCTEVDIWGYDFDLDNKPVNEGWWFICAKSGSRTYYSYRAVKVHDDGKWAHNASVGFKLKPSHFTLGESENKGYTDRITPIF